MTSIDRKIENALDYILSGGSMGEYVNNNSQGFAMMQASVTYTLNGTIIAGSPTRPLFVMTQTDEQSPRQGMIACRFPAGVGRSSCYDLYPVATVPIFYALAPLTTNGVANAFFTLNPWPSGLRLGVVPFTPAAAGFFPENLGLGSGYGVSNSTIQDTFDRGYTMSNTFTSRSTTIDAGVNALTGSIYGAIVQDKPEPRFANKAGLAGLTDARGGAFYVGSIMEPVTCLLVPNTSEVAYFVNNSVRQLSQSRVVSAVTTVPAAGYTIADFGVDSDPLANLTFPIFNAIEQGIFYNQGAFSANIQVQIVRSNFAVLASTFDLALTFYAHWGNNDETDEFRITSVVVDQTTMNLPVNLNQPVTINLSFDCPTPVQPSGSLIRVMPFYFIGIGVTAEVQNSSSILPTPLDVGPYLTSISFTTSLRLTDLSVTGDEVSGIHVFNDYTGPYECTQELRLSAIPNVANVALLGGYVKASEFQETVKVVKEFLTTTFGSSGGLIGSDRMYKDMLQNLNGKDSAYVNAPQGGYTMSTFRDALKSQRYAPRRMIPETNYFSASLKNRLKNFGKRVMKSPFGGAIREIGETAYKVGGDMIYDTLEDETGLDFRDMARDAGVRGYRSSSYPQDSTNQLNPLDLSFYHLDDADMNNNCLPDLCPNLTEEFFISNPQLDGLYYEYFDLSRIEGTLEKPRKPQYFCSRYGVNRFEPTNTMPAMYCSSLPTAPALTGQIHSSILLPLTRIKRGKGSSDDAALIRAIMAANGAQLLNGYTSSSITEFMDVGEDSAPNLEGLTLEEDTNAVPRRVVDLIDPSYGATVSGVTVPSFNGVSSALSRLVEKKATPTGSAYFISVGETQNDTPLIVKLSMLPQAPSSTQTFAAYYFEVVGSGSNVTATVVGPDYPGINQVLRVTEQLNFNTGALAAAVTYLLRAGVTFQNTEYLSIEEGFVGGVLTGESFILAFVAACMNVPFGPIFTGLVSKEGQVQPVGDIDIKILAVNGNPRKSTLFIPKQELGDASTALTVRTVLRLNYMRLGSVESSILPISFVYEIFALLNSTAMAPALINSSQSFTQKDKVSELKGTNLVDYQRKQAEKEVRLKEVSEESLASIILGMKNRAVKKARGEFFKRISDSKGVLQYNGQLIDNSNVGDFMKANPNFNAIVAHEYSKSVTENFRFKNEDHSTTYQVLDFTKLERPPNKPVIKLKQPISNKTKLLKSMETYEDF